MSEVPLHTLIPKQDIHLNSLLGVEEPLHTTGVPRSYTGGRFRMSEVPMKTLNLKQDIHLNSLLGSGSFAEVHAASWQLPCAVKRLKDSVRQSRPDIRQSMPDYGHVSYNTVKATNKTFKATYKTVNISGSQGQILAWGSLLAAPVRQAPQGFGELLPTYLSEST